MMSCKKITIMIIALMVCFFMSCKVNDSTEEPLPEEPWIIGTITDIKDGNVYSSILIEENPKVTEPTDPGGIKIWFVLIDQTEIFIRQKNGELVEAGIESVQIGQKAKGWEAGLIEPSQPAQGPAKRIVVIEE